MDTLNVVTRHIVVLCLILLLGWTSVLAKSSPKNAEINKRIENLNTIIDIRITDEVIDQINLIVEKNKRDSETILGRTSLYFPTIENALREKNLPDELKYIAVIESSLMPHIESHQGAAGIWQFMEGTATLYGLRIDKHIDERKDLAKSTDKALDYLKLLYQTYGNWTTALAAYNFGPGNINKAIKKANGSTNYWDIYKHLPKETKKYIPRFIAVSYLMNYYFMHDLKPTEPSDDLKYIASVKVFSKVEFKSISKEFDIDIDLIKMLNPMYNKDYIPESTEGMYFLTLPEQKMYGYIEKYNSFDNLLYKPIMAATKTDTTEETIAEVRNKILIEYLANVDKGRSGYQIDSKDYSAITNIAESMRVKTSAPVMYQLKKKESLMDVADANGLTLETLMELNDINDDSDINPGSIIKLSR